MNAATPENAGAPENAGGPEVSWSPTWEDDLTAADHAALAALFRRAYPGSEAFSGARSWSGGRPELRLLGRLDGRMVAHVGILRRFLQVGGVAQLVGDVGLVAVDPQLHGRGLGADLLARAAATLRALRLPFGLLTCGEHVAGFYARGGWMRVDNPTRMVRADGRVQVYGEASMVLAVERGIAAWPAGRVDRNGLEVGVRSATVLQHGTVPR